MPELDTSDLRRLLDHAASTVAPSPDAWAAIDARLDEATTPDTLVDVNEPGDATEIDLPLAAVDGRTLRRPRRLAVLAVAAAILAVLGVVGVLANRRGDDGVGDGERRYPILRKPPAGLALEAGTLAAYVAESSPADATLELVDATGDRGYTVGTSLVSVDRFPGVETTVDVNGITASWRSWFGEQSLTWEQGTMAVTVRAFGRVDEAEWLQVARGLTITRNSSLRTTIVATFVPPGMTAGDSAPAGSFALDPLSTTDYHREDLSAAADPRVTLQSYAGDLPTALARLAGAGSQPATVRGRKAYLRHQDATVDQPATTTLVWSPRAGLLVSLTAQSLTDDVVLAAAADVELVTESEYRELTGDLLSDPGTDVVDGTPSALTPIVEQATDGVAWRLSAATMRNRPGPCWQLRTSDGSVSNVCPEDQGAGGLGELLTTEGETGLVHVVIVTSPEVVAVRVVDDRGTELVRSDVVAVGADPVTRIAVLTVPAGDGTSRTDGLTAAGATVGSIPWPRDRGTGAPSIEADRAAFADLGPLASGTVGDLAWTLRGGMVPTVSFDHRTGATEPAAGTLPCVVLGLGGRDLVNSACLGGDGGVAEPAMAALVATLSPSPRHTIAALVEPDVAAFELTFTDGSSRTVATVAVPGTDAVRGVGIVLADEERLTSIVAVGSDGARHPAMTVDVPGKAPSSVVFGSQSGTMGDGGPATTVVAADLPSLATSVPTTAP